MASLPSFLCPLPSRPSHGPYANAVFDHPPPLGPAHCLWWPPLKPGMRVETIVLFIPGLSRLKLLSAPLSDSSPGNPGLLDFYSPFLTALQDKDLTENLAILAHAHIDHTPGVYNDTTPHSRHSLDSQVQSAIEAFDALASEFAPARVMIIGHSVGSWVALQVSFRCPVRLGNIFTGVPGPERTLGCRCRRFPSLSYHLSYCRHTKWKKALGQYKLFRCSVTHASNHNLKSLFKPLPRRVIARLTVIGKRIPLPVLHRLVGLEWPINQLKVLLELIRSPDSVRATLRMGDEEMLQIRDLDVNLLQENRHRLWFYFADHDDWVGKQRHHILSNFKPDSGSLRITLGEPFIPHAFCISECYFGANSHPSKRTCIDHGEEVARQCHQWLLEMNINLSLI